MPATKRKSPVLYGTITADRLQELGLPSVTPAEIETINERLKALDLAKALYRHQVKLSYLSGRMCLVIGSMAVEWKFNDQVLVVLTMHEGKPVVHVLPVSNQSTRALSVGDYFQSFDTGEVFEKDADTSYPIWSVKILTLTTEGEEYPDF